MAFLGEARWKNNSLHTSSVQLVCKAESLFNMLRKIMHTGYHRIPLRQRQSLYDLRVNMGQQGSQNEMPGNQCVISHRWVTILSLVYGNGSVVLSYPTFRHCESVCLPRYVSRPALLRTYDETLCAAMQT